MKKKTLSLAVVFAMLLIALTGCESYIAEEQGSDGLVAENEATSNPNESSPPIVGMDLFELVYVPFAQGEERTAFSDVKAFIDDSGYEYSCVEPTTESTGEIKVFSDDDYVYFAFFERSSGAYTIMTVSYYHASSNSEVSLSNYSTNGDHSYDKLTTHKIGESDETVSSVAEQREFLFAADQDEILVEEADDQLPTVLSAEEMTIFIENTLNTSNDINKYTTDYDGTKISVIQQFSGLETAVRTIVAAGDTELAENWETAKSTKIAEYNAIRELMDAGGCREIPLVFDVCDGDTTVLIIENGKITYDLSTTEELLALTDSSSNVPTSTPDPKPESATAPESTPKTAPTPAPAPTPTPTSTPTPAPATTVIQQSGTYVGSVESDKYHYPSCRFAKKILPENEIWFGTTTEAQAAGYSACGTCKP